MHIYTYKVMTGNDCFYIVYKLKEYYITVAMTLEMPFPKNSPIASVTADPMLPSHSTICKKI